MTEETIENKTGKEGYSLTFLTSNHLFLIKINFSDENIEKELQVPTEVKLQSGVRLYDFMREHDITNYIITMNNDLSITMVFEKFEDYMFMKFNLYNDIKKEE